MKKKLREELQPAKRAEHRGLNMRRNQKARTTQSERRVSKSIEYEAVHGLCGVRVTHCHRNDRIKKYFTDRSNNITD